MNNEQLIELLKVTKIDYVNKYNKLKEFKNLNGQIMQKTSNIITNLEALISKFSGHVTDIKTVNERLLDNEKKSNELKKLEQEYLFKIKGLLNE